MPLSAIGGQPSQKDSSKHFTLSVIGLVLVGWAVSIPLSGSTNQPRPVDGMRLPDQFLAKSANVMVEEKTDKADLKDADEAIIEGLKWFAAHQAKDGHWAMEGFRDAGKCNCSGDGARNDVGGTALALLPFLGAGITHKLKDDKKQKKEFVKVVNVGIKYLLAKQGRDGYFGGTMYAHALATVVLCESFHMTSDVNLKVPAQKALDVIVFAQGKEGGWRYDPKPAKGDTSITGWQLTALKCGEKAGLKVPPKTIANVQKFLDFVQEKDGARYGYTDGDTPTTSMTAVGILCRQYLGWTREKKDLEDGVKMVLSNPPGVLNSVYYFLNASRALHFYGGKEADQWDEKMHAHLLKAQDKGEDEKRPHEKGSWSPKGDAFARAGGRIMQTSMSLLILEIPYGQLSMFQLDSAPKKK